MEKNENDAMFRGLFEGADLTGAQIIVKNESGGIVINHKHEASSAENPHFPFDGDRTEGERVYQNLINEGFIPADTDEDSFLYVMGYSTEMNGRPSKIVWLKQKQLAREFLTLRNERSINSSLLRKSTMERLASELFLMDGLPLKLAKNKPVPSVDSDKLEKILRP